MDWIIKIFNKKNCRIVIKYEPLNDCLKFIGQYQPNITIGWVDMCVLDSKLDVDLEGVSEILYKTYNVLDEKIEYYNIFNNTFKMIGEIDVQNEE